MITILWDFDIQMDYLISAKQPQQKERTCHIVKIALPAERRVK